MDHELSKQPLGSTDGLLGSLSYASPASTTFRLHLQRVDACGTLRVRAPPQPPMDPRAQVWGGEGSRTLVLLTLVANSTAHRES